MKTSLEKAIKFSQKVLRISQQTHKGYLSGVFCPGGFCLRVYVRRF